MSNQKDTRDFILKARSIHGERYDYSLTLYTKARDKIKIICPEHGVFEQTAFNHIAKKPSGCPVCAGQKQLTLVEFIEKAKELHGDKYDYSLVDYRGSLKPVKIICPEHGVFKQKPFYHYSKGAGCKLCAQQKTFLTNNEFIEKAKKIHGEKYDYSLVDYKSTHKKIKIICPIHGIFLQTPNTHLSGSGCMDCSGKKQLTNEKFIEKARTIHKDKYDYSLIDYKNNRSKIKIICPEHGTFEQIALHHIGRQSCGCPDCAKANQTSKGEKEVLDYVKTIYSGNIIENTRKVIKPYELDIYIPDLKIGIEYNGDYWHRKIELDKPGYHELKQKLCSEANVKLINVQENDWNTKKEEVKQFLKTTINN